MSTIFATASSTIHADLIVVGLKRLGISMGGISVLYPSDSTPDSVLYWLDGASRLELSPAGETVTVSGPLRFVLDRCHTPDAFPSVTESFRALGLSPAESVSLEATLLADRVVICVETADEDELALIFHTLHHIGAEKIIVSDTEPFRPAPEGPSRRGSSVSHSACAGGEKVVALSAA